jgi:hypothetical protein
MESIELNKITYNFYKEYCEGMPAPTLKKVVQAHRDLYWLLSDDIHDRIIKKSLSMQLREQHILEVLKGKAFTVHPSNGFSCIALGMWHEYAKYHEEENPLEWAKGQVAKEKGVKGCNPGGVRGLYLTAIGD